MELNPDNGMHCSTLEKHSVQTAYIPLTSMCTVYLFAFIVLSEFIL